MIVVASTDDTMRRHGAKGCADCGQMIKWKHEKSYGNILYELQSGKPR
jgi:hypothetical protein